MNRDLLYKKQQNKNKYKRKQNNTTQKPQKQKHYIFCIALAIGDVAD